MNEKRKEILSIFCRYLILLITALPNLYLFYLIFTPLTIFPSHFLINQFYPSKIEGSLIVTSCNIIELLDACIAGAAYYLLLVLNLTTSNISLKTRIKSIAFSWAAFLSINVARIFIFSILFLTGFTFFSTTHLLFWYLGSTLIIFLIWLAEIKLFKIKDIPVYSDLKVLFKEIKF